MLIFFNTNEYFNAFSEHKDTSFYTQKIQFILMYMFQFDQTFTKTAIAKQSVEACGNIFHQKILFDSSSGNIQKREKFFWTKHQRELIEQDPKRVLFTSNYGTGKTLALKAKALHLGRKRQFFYFSKKQADQRNVIDSRETFLEATQMQLERKEIINLKNNTNQENLTDPGKTFFILFSQPNALIFHSVQQDFEKLQDHVQILCFKGQLYFCLFWLSAVFFE
jgi:hypothetical protein